MIITPNSKEESKGIISQEVTEIRLLIIKVWLNRVPGPGKYNSHFQALKKNDPNTVFDRSIRIKNQKSEIPGVGAYNVNHKEINRSKGGYSLGKSRRFSLSNVNFFLISFDICKFKKVLFLKLKINSVIIF